MEYTEKQIRKLAIKRYGNDRHMWAKQRDGFVAGFHEAMQQIKIGLDKNNKSSVHCDGCGEMVNRKEWLGVCNKCRNK